MELLGGVPRAAFVFGNKEQCGSYHVQGVLQWSGLCSAPFSFLLPLVLPSATALFFPHVELLIKVSRVLLPRVGAVARDCPLFCC